MSLVNYFYCSWKSA